MQIILFASIAIELKRRAPNAHTFLEAVRARYGPVTHGVYIVFSIFTNILGKAVVIPATNSNRLTNQKLPQCFSLVEVPL